MGGEICITGIGIAACLGLDLETIWRRVRAGECGMGPMPALETSLPTGKDGGQAPDLPADFWPDLPREARYLRWTIEAALRDAHVDVVAVDPTRVALLLGTTLHGMRAGGEFLRTGDHSKLTAFLAGDTARLATDGLPIGGLSATTCSACSSSLGAIAMAVTVLERGEADILLAGGYDAVSEYAYAGFGSLRLISDAPLRPFAKGRTGMKVAEGYGVVVLERRADAERRGADIRAVVAGWGESADAHHLTRPHPEGEGALAAMRQAAKRAGIDANQLDLVAAHATGTPDNDSSEAAAIATFLGGGSTNVPVVGFKSHLGHTLGGAGAVELALSAMSIRDSIIPPTANACVSENEYPQLHVTREAIERPVRYTLNTSLGFGGANTCVVLRAPKLTPTAPRSDRVSKDNAPTSSQPAARSGRTSIGVSPSSDVAITGVGVLVPSAIGNEAFATLLREKRPVDRRTIDDADFEHLVNARRMRRMSTYVKLSICAATIAARDAGVLDNRELMRGAGAILGTTHGSAGYCYDYYAQVVREGIAAANPVLFAEGVPNAAAAQMSLTLGLTGSCQTILGTRTAGLDALRLAAMRIAAGESDRLIVCAAEEAHETLDAAYAGCDEAAGDSASVSLAVAFVLESRGLAAARGARIRAVLGDGASATRTGPESRTDVLRRALAGPSRPTISRSPVPLSGSAFSAEPLLGLAGELLGSAAAEAAEVVLLATDRGRLVSSILVQVGSAG